LEKILLGRGDGGWENLLLSRDDISEAAMMKSSWRALFSAAMTMKFQVGHNEVKVSIQQRRRPRFSRDEAEPKGL